MGTSRAFFRAIGQGDYKTVRELLEKTCSEEEKQALLQAREYNDTGFLLAVRIEEYKIAGLLLDNGAKVDSIDSIGKSATTISIQRAQQGDKHATRFWGKLMWRGNSERLELRWYLTKTIVTQCSISMRHLRIEMMQS